MRASSNPEFNDKFLDLYISLPKEFSISEETSNILTSGPFSSTKIGRHIEFNKFYAIRTFTFKLDKEKEYSFKKLCSVLVKLNYPCMKPISFVIMTDKKRDIDAAICTSYSSNKSLNDVIVNFLMNGVKPDNWDPTQTFIVFYGISRYLECLHKDLHVHGRLKASNILLNERNEPLVSDPMLYQLNQDIPPLKVKKTYDYIVSLPPEVLNDQKVTACSDIYSFGILLLQVLTQQINVYANYTKYTDEIINLIKSGQKPQIPEDIAPNIASLIDKCLSFNQEERPSIHDIVDELDKTISNEGLYDVKRFLEFKQMINNTEERMDQKVKEFKKEADNGDIEMMFAYGRARYYGEGCIENTDEAMKYLRFAAKKEHAGAKELYSSIIKNISRDVINDDDDSISESDDNHIHLKDDTYFNEEKTDFNEIAENVKSHQNEKKKKTIVILMTI